MISIITINYNNLEGLRSTIYSVLIQSSNDYEFIIIDGGSTDGSVELIQENEKMLKYWVSEKDNGPFHAMNKGVAVACGEYCIFMNSGDSFYDTNVIENFVNCKNDKDIYIGITAEHLQDRVRMWYPMEELEMSMRKLYRGSISHQSSFIKRNLLLLTPYDESLKIVSDWKFFVETIILENVLYSTLSFVVANYMDGGISRNEEDAFAEREIVLKDLFSERQLRDFHYMQFGSTQWEKIAKKVDPASKIGKLVYYLTVLLLKLRR